MRRVEALAVLARVPALRVCNLGYPSRELYAAADDPSTFYMLGSMGLASSIGLGLAIAQGRRVVAIDGDGSVLMNLGTLATIARYAPPNFTLVILDNGVHGSAGNRPSGTSFGVSLAEVAAACGLPRVADARTPGELRQLLRRSGPAVVVAKVEAGNESVPVIPLSARAIRDRFSRSARARVPRGARGPRGPGKG